MNMPQPIHFETEIMPQPIDVDGGRYCRTWVRSQQMVSTPIAELNREIVKEDGWNEFDFIIQTRD